MITTLERPAFVVAGIPVLAPFEHLAFAVPEAWAAAFADLEGTFAEASTYINGRYHEVVGILVDLEDHLDGFVHTIVPAGEYAHLTHVGPRSAIADSFGGIESWALDHGRVVGSFKLDVGYQADGMDRVHELYVSLVPREAS
ncbi:effector binding domain-containing protein [Microbacterium sp. ASV49]|uniref:AraC family transcriptional regulator n=1 Tax=Microbacterium candidum TaxID=3041922 RepID=A0ABT7MW81_9MICO|nr:hypothetical protein [Microbacterium sp. ASV49]MDL9978711.1 hypothetical protein [Microbacterium sp. ASV49]